MMKLQMKKKATAIALILMITLIMTGCGKSEITIALPDFNDYELTEIPDGLESCSKTEDGIVVTVKKNGDYTFTIKDDTGTEHTFTLVYKNRSAEVQSDEELSVNLSSR